MNKESMSRLAEKELRTSVAIEVSCPAYAESCRLPHTVLDSLADFNADPSRSSILARAWMLASFLLN